jgi:hypothetical protein
MISALHLKYSRRKAAQYKDAVAPLAIFAFLGYFIVKYL